MKRFTKARCGLCCLLLWLPATVAFGQQSTNYKIENWALTTGGGSCSSTSWQIPLFALGQSAVGPGTSTTWDLHSGFIVPSLPKISGNAGVGNAMLSYTDGGAKTACADNSGYYSFSVSSGWTGTVTPSKTGYTFSPASRSYSHLAADQVHQDYTATLIPLTVNFVAGSGGTLTGTTSQIINYGSDCSPVTAVPASGYHFVNWTGTGGFVVSTANPLTVTGVITDMTITANFAITFVTVCYPNGGESLRAGKTYNIKWASSGINNVSIKLYKGGVRKATIASKVAAASGSYSWTVPASQALGSDYQIVISSVDSGVVASDCSVENFSIVAASTPAQAGDFNRDGKSDVLWRFNGTGGFNAVWLLGTGVSDSMRGKELERIFDSRPEMEDAEEMPDDGAAVEQTFRGQATYTDPRNDPQSVDLASQSVLNYVMVGSGDFNGDNEMDILWRHDSTGKNLVWTMNGVAKTGSTNLPQLANLNWELVGLGDFNSDTKVDVLWRSLADGKNMVWYMNGFTRTSTAYLLQEADLNWGIAGTGDFNSDGRVDILWRNKADGRNQIWYMDGKNRTGTAFLLKVWNQNWEIAGTGDFDGDKKVDILWRNKLDGRNEIWFMNGITRTSYAFLSRVSDHNWQIGN